MFISLIVKRNPKVVGLGLIWSTVPGVLAYSILLLCLPQHMVQNRCFNSSHPINNPASSRKVEKNHTTSLQEHFLEINLTISAYIPVARTQSYDHMLMQERLGNVIFILGGHLTSFKFHCYERRGGWYEGTTGSFFFFSILRVAGEGLSPASSTSARSFWPRNFCLLYFQRYHSDPRRVKGLGRVEFLHSLYQPMHSRASSQCLPLSPLSSSFFFFLKLSEVSDKWLRSLCRFQILCRISLLL